MVAVGGEYRRWAGLTSVLLLVLLLQGCGGGGSGGSAAVSPDASETAAGPEMPAARGSQSGAQAVESFDRMVVKTAELGLKAGNVRESVDEAREVSDRFGGDVLSSRVYGARGRYRPTS